MPTKNNVTTTTLIDPDDAPPLGEEWFQSASLYEGEKLIRKGGRPKSETPKVAVHIRLDADIVQHFRASGPGWQTRLNEALRHTMER